MTVKELIERLQKIGDPDAPVCVRVTHTVSADAGAVVTGAYRGFDWSTGKVILETDSKLLREHDTCKRCGMYGVKAAKDISSRYHFTDMETGDMEVAVYLGKKKMFAVPFNTRREIEETKKEQK